MRTIPDHHAFTMRITVTPEMTATFFGCEIHPLYATFVLIEHAEYASRQAILPFLEEHEDAIGASIQLEHTAPTPIGWTVEITATVIEVDERSIVCELVASSRDGVIARGSNRQQVVNKGRLLQRIASLYDGQPPTTASSENSV